MANQSRFIYIHVEEGEADGLPDGEGEAAFSKEALMAFNKTMEVYLLSSE